jgi:hypothetical protein
MNKALVKTVPQGAIDQIGHALSHIIHAFASMPPDEKIFMAKWGTKDGFWHHHCKEGKEWNFAYVLSELKGPSTNLVISNSLQFDNCTE